MWFKVDDKLHVNRKARRLLNSHDSKRLDAAPMGLWVLAGSWAGQNTHEIGWVPEYELDRWDDDWRNLAARLVAADLWWPERRDGEAGYAFVNWDEYKPSAGAADDGRRGNHIKWHVNRKKVSPSCEFCPKEPDDESDLAPDEHHSSPPNRGDHRGETRGDIGSPIGSIANPNPNPTRDEPETNLSCSSDADASSARMKIEQDFADWYQAYPRKRGKADALKAYRAARKAKVSHQTLVDALAAQLPEFARRNIEHVPYPATWIRDASWEDELEPQQAAGGSNDPLLDEHGRYRDIPAHPTNPERWEDETA